VSADTNPDATPDGDGSLFDPGLYGRLVGDDYDAIYEGVFDTEGAVALLGRLAGPGSLILELGVGTGRLALPLAARDHEVWGVDASAEMLDQLTRKAGGKAVRCVLGDFSEVAVDRTFDVAVITFNTIFALPDQDAQVRCFANVAHHLRPGGLFVVEAWVPEPPKTPPPVLSTRRVAEGLVGLVLSEHDRARQLLSTTQVVLGGPRNVLVYPVVHRYAHPSELDLMARLAGMALEHRYADWRGTPYSSSSTDHVSIYRREDAQRTDHPAAT